MVSQRAATKGVEGANGQFVGAFGPDQLCDTRTHFGSSLVGESHRQNIVWVNALGQHMRHAVSNGAGFAGSSARQNQQRPLNS